MTYDLRLDVRELEELKRLIEAAGNDTLQKVLKQVHIGLFQANLKEGDWFRSRKTGEVHQALTVNREWEQIEYFDPWKQKSEWMSLHDARPVTPEEIEAAKKHREELYHRFHERCERIEAFLRKEYPSASPEQVDHLDDEDVPLDIEVDGKVIGRYALQSRFTVHYTVNMEDRGGLPPLLFFGKEVSHGLHGRIHSLAHGTWQRHPHHRGIPGRTPGAHQVV